MKNLLVNRWLESGLKKNDDILLHSSFKRTFVELKSKNYLITPKNILESFLEICSTEGTLIIPTFNFDFNDGIDYNYFTTKSQMGQVSEEARNHPLAIRTLNPVYSFAVFGKKANLFRDIDNESWYSKTSPFNFIHKFNFKICIIDLNDRNSMTFAHYCEEYFQVKWRYYKYFTGNYTNKYNLLEKKIYKGYVKKIDEGVETTLNPAGELLWEKKLYKGNRPFIKNGLRYVRSKDYFNLFKELFHKDKCRPYYYDIKLNNIRDF